MSHIAELVRHSGHYLGGRAALMLLGFLSFPVFTRLFSVAQYGEIDFVLKVALMLTVLSKLGLQHAVPRLYPEYAAAGPQQMRQYYATFLFGALLIATAVAFLYALSLGLVAPRMTPGAATLLTLSVALVFTGGIRSTVVNILRAQQRTGLFNIIDVSTKLGALALTYGLLVLWRVDTRALIIGHLTAETVALSVLVWLLAGGNAVRPSEFSLPLLKRGLRFGFPLIWYEAANMMLDSGDRVLVQYFCGSAALGYYSAAYNIGGYFQDLLITPVNLAVYPIYVSLWQSKGAGATATFVSRGLELFFWTAIPLTGLGIALSEPLVRLLASQKFVAAHVLLPILLPAFAVFAILPFLNAGLLLHNRTGSMATITIAAALTNIGLNVVLLKPLGVRGAAVATLCGYVLLAALTARVSARLFPLRWNLGALARCVGASLAAWAAASMAHHRSAVVVIGVRSALYAAIFAALFLWLEPTFRDLVLRNIRGIRNRSLQAGDPDQQALVNQAGGQRT